ncbi:unnamed protein product [Effrenium voratum]|uniref:Uncharacterized protein n=1 Tax=Effrenium voratum TaxID=2562239 RepID=A0AA36HUU7_9DINO|nr:unnamed protein product [Effrenium voratum]
MSSRSWHGQHAQLLESDDERSSWGSMPGRVVCPAAAVLMLLGTALVVAPQRMKTIRGSAVGYSADYADQAPQIMLLQFNPHWECFKGPNMEQCGNAVYGMVTRLLNQYQVDFANIVELPPTYKPPEGWAMNCRPGGGGETSCIIWRNSSWEVIEPKTDCWFGRGRACNVMTFNNPNLTLKVSVAGAHFPHGVDTGWYSEFLGVLRYNLEKSKSVTDKVIMLVDSNAGLHQEPDTQMLQKIGALSPHTSQPEMWYKYRTCCNNIGYHLFYDRVAANFGTHLDQVKDAYYGKQSADFHTTPWFAKVAKPNSAAAGEYHQPLMARLSL